MSATATIDKLRDRGIYALTDGVRVTLRGPADVLTDELIEHLREQKADLIRALRQGVDELDAAAREYFEERAAIAEHDGEMPRREAEREAARRVYEYMLADRPGRWLLMIAAHGDGLAEVEKSIRERFGSERVLGVRQYQPGELS